MHQPLSAYKSIVPSAQYSEKPSQLTSSVFSTVPSITPSQQPTLLPSSLTTEIPIIIPIITSTIYTAKSLSNKNAWLSFLNQVKIPAGNHHISLVQCPLCFKA